MRLPSNCAAMRHEAPRPLAHMRRTQQAAPFGGVATFFRAGGHGHRCLSIGDTAFPSGMLKCAFVRAFVREIRQITPQMMSDRQSIIYLILNVRN